MERVATKPESEQLKSFDILASIDMLQFDLQRFGQVLPETRQRVYDEELTYVAEGIDRPLYVSFTLQSDTAGNLQYFKDGAWRPYMGLLVTGLQAAEQEARQDPRKEFLAERAADDLRYGYAMQSLAPGESTAWFSPYPEKEAHLYGEAYVAQFGFRPARKMGFLYKASKHVDGSVTLETQSVDGSNAEGFAAAMRTAVIDPEADMEAVLRSYDGAMQMQTGHQYRAGRRILFDRFEENAWEAVTAHRDLLEYFFGELENMAAAQLSRVELEIEKKRLTYGVWATLKQRMDAQAEPSDRTNYQSASYDVIGAVQLQQEIRRAYLVAASRGEVLQGCGGTIGASKGDEALLDMSAEDVFDSIFGKSEKSGDTDSYSFDKKMYCVVCQAPPRKNESKKFCGPCGICRGCDTAIRKRNPAA